MLASIALATSSPLVVIVDGRNPRPRPPHDSAILRDARQQMADDVAQKRRDHKVRAGSPTERGPRRGRPSSSATKAEATVAPRPRANCNKRSNSLESQRLASTGGMTPGFYNVGSVIETSTVRCTSCTQVRPSGRASCPHCGSPAYPHRRTAEEHADYLRAIAERDRVASKLDAKR